MFKLKEHVWVTTEYSQTCLTQEPKERAKAVCLKQVLAQYRSIYTENATLGFENLALSDRFCLAEVAFKIDLTVQRL